MMMMDITPDTDVPIELRTSYHKLILMLKERSETCVSLQVSPITTDKTLVESEDILIKMSTLMRHFMETSKIREKTCSMWATTRLGFYGDFEITMNHTDYDLCAATYGTTSLFAIYGDYLLSTVFEKYH